MLLTWGQIRVGRSGEKYLRHRSGLGEEAGWTWEASLYHPLVGRRLPMTAQVRFNRSNSVLDGSIQLLREVNCLTNQSSAPLCFAISESRGWTSRVKMITAWRGQFRSGTNRKRIWKPDSGMSKSRSTQSIAPSPHILTDRSGVRLVKTVYFAEKLVRESDQYFISPVEFLRWPLTTGAMWTSPAFQECLRLNKVVLWSDAAKRVKKQLDHELVRRITQAKFAIYAVEGWPVANGSYCLLRQCHRKEVDANTLSASRR